MFAKALARNIQVDYRLLVASAYSGFVVWHGGLAGSIPLTIATPGHFSENQIGVIATGNTLFSSFNLILLAILFIVVPLVNRLMMPPADESIFVSPDKLHDDPMPSAENTRPADKLENSKLLAVLVAFVSAESLPVWSFISAGVVNIFVPSGGGQWAVQAPVILPAAAELGADVSRVAMAVAWGDAWTNLIQPFWALPVLAIAGLKAKDIMGFCLVQLIVTGIIISLVLRFV